MDPTALGQSLSRLLVPPLAALRASIEALGEEIDRDSLPDTRLQGTLEEVTRLARDVQSLVELAAPASLAPLSCSLEEIAHGALRLLSTPQRARVRFARPVHERRVETDGPIASRALAYLLLAALECSSESVLLRAEGEGGQPSLAVVCSGSEQVFEHPLSNSDRSSRSTALAVRMTVARRDAERLGGRLAVRSSARGVVHATLELPSRRPGRPRRKESRR